MNKKLDFEKYLNPDDSVSEEGVKAGAITISTQFIKFFNQIVTFSILAHILEPKDFGLLAMSTGFISIIKILVGQAFTKGIIQKKNITHLQMSSFFWIVIFLSFIFTAFTVSISPFIAKFYNDTRIFYIMLILSLQVFFSGISFCHISLLQRNMKFGTLSGIELFSGVCSKIIGIVLAYLGFKYWALVFIEVSYEGIRGLLAWIYFKWRPAFKFRGQNIKDLLNFGTIVSLSSIFESISIQIDNIMLGLFFNSKVVGLYSKSVNLTKLPIRLIIWPLERVSISTLSKLQDDKLRFKSNFLAVSKYSLLILVPVFLLLIIATKEIVMILLGHKWLPAIPLIKWSSIYFYIVVFEYPVGWFLLIKGLLKKFFLWSSVFNSFVRIFSIMIGLKWGALGVVISLVIGKILFQPIYTYYAFKKSEIKFLEFFVIFKEIFLATFVAGGLGVIARDYIFIGFTNIFLNLLLISFVVVSSYLLILFVLPVSRKDLFAAINFIRKKKVVAD